MAAAKKKKGSKKGAEEPALPLREEINLTTGEQRACDNSYGAKATVAPGSVGNDKVKQKTVDGEATTVLGNVDVDLPVHAQNALAETGFFEDYVAFPWAVVRPGTAAGTPLPPKGSGFSAYLVTMAAPVDLNAPDGGGSSASSSSNAATKKSKKKGKEQYVCNPATITVEVFLERVWEGCSLHKVHLRKSVGRREVPKGHNHLHAAVSAGNTNYRLRYGQIAKFLILKYGMYTNWTAVPYSSGLHRATKGNPRLDRFLNGDGKNRTLARTRLACALESINLRKDVAETLLGQLLAAADEQVCVCGGRQLQATRDWSAKIKWSDRCKRSPNAAGIQVIHWAISGRGAGNTLVFYGPTGGGKTWILEMLKACLGDRFFAIPGGEQSYPFEQLGNIYPEKLAFCLDELSIRRLAKWLGGGSSEGWWKLWLSTQTDSRFTIALPKNKECDRNVFAEPSPIVYSATAPVRLNVGDDEFKEEYAVERENDQQRRRELRAYCGVKVCRGNKLKITPCGKCFSQYIREVNDAEGIWCTDTNTRLKTDIELEPSKSRRSVVEDETRSPTPSKRRRTEEGRTPASRLRVKEEKANSPSA
eukprot:g18681.t1